MSLDIQATNPRDSVLINKDVRQEKALRIALVGNPNCGKSTIFNALTGLNQKIANYPGVTVDKRSGFTIIKGEDGKKLSAEIIDLPGTYSLYPKSLDERIPFKVLCDPAYMEQPDLVIVIADSTNLKRNLFLCSQITDLNIPVILALNMIDLVQGKGIKINYEKLEKKLGIKVLPVNARAGEGVKELREEIGRISLVKNDKSFIEVEKYDQKVVEGVKKILHLNSNYSAWLCASNLEFLSFSKNDLRRKEELKHLLSVQNFDPNKAQAAESLERYKVINEILKECQESTVLKPGFTSKIDKILTHKIYGYLVFLFLLFVIFQTLFYVASYPMDLIDGFFAELRTITAQSLPEGILNDLLVNGVLAGLAGVVVFVPQIALLFFFIGLMEDTGYMARVSFMMDKLLRRFGLNGKSVIPLMSGVACAVPAIMSTRTIPSWKERIITIMVTPLMSCSARLPVYALMIALIIPATTFGIINLQGIVLMGLYLIGFGAALMAAFLMKFLVKTRERGYYMMEIPVYRLPKWSNLGYTILEKVKIFLFDAGKVIVAISIVLWFLSSFGPAVRMEKIEQKYSAMEAGVGVNDELSKMKDAEKLENSYAGILGKSIEPAIKPLGFDWKIGIALITSFAAREVFVGTMSTIYSVQGDEEDIKTIKEKMQSEINPSTGGKMYTAAVGFSLMLFYAFAMQCMSTIAVVRRETASWKWPLIQIAYMSGLAYLASLLAYNLIK